MFGDSPLQAINRQTYNSFQFRVRPPPWRQRKAKSCDFCHCQLSTCCLNKMNRNNKKLRVVLSCTNRKMILFNFCFDLAHIEAQPCPNFFLHVQSRPLLYTAKVEALSDFSSTRSNSALSDLPCKSSDSKSSATFLLKGLSDTS